MYPKLVIDTAAIAQNVRVVTSLCAEHGIRACGITKAVRGSEQVARAFADNGVASLGDSRLPSLEKLDDIGLQRKLIRTPQLSDVDEVVRVTEVSCNSELQVLQALEEACVRQGVAEHGIMLMYDLGDLREGFVDEGELLEAARLVAKSPHLRLNGIGANLNCLSFVRPDTEKMELLVEASEKLGEYADGPLVVSGGNSSNLQLLLAGGMPESVNELRLGESLLLGRERAGYTYLPGTRNDAFVLQAEIIEVKEKPSMPWGTFGADSYGVVHEFEDRGVRRRALVALGALDCDPEVMWPIDEGIEIIGCSSDHLVLDIGNASSGYHLGDIVEFRCGYHAIAHAFVSELVEKEFV